MTGRKMLGSERVREPSPKAGPPPAVRFRKFQVQIGPVQRDASPEKACVGGSIPSLATIISTRYKPSTSRLRSKMFQLRGGVGLFPRRILNVFRCLSSEHLLLAISAKDFAK